MRGLMLSSNGDSNATPKSRRTPSAHAIRAVVSDSSGPYALYLAIRAGASPQQQRRLIAVFFLTSNEIAEARAAASLVDWSEEDRVYLRD